MNLGATMTDVEVGAWLDTLRKGDLIEYRRSDGVWITVALIDDPQRSPYTGAVACFYARPLGNNRRGHKLPCTLIAPYSWARVRVRPLPDAPPQDRVRANVFADWLEEHGFTEAGAALRGAFPLINGD